MAKVGVLHPVYKLPEKAGKVMGKAITVNVSASSNSTKLYADNVVVESDTGFTEGSTMNVNTDHLSLETQADLLGHKYSEEGGMISHKDDVAPYVGFGFIGQTKKDNELGWTGKYYPKVQFGEPSDDNQTKGETVDFQTPTIEGAFYSNDEGTWKEEAEFITEAAALAWLNEKASIAPTP